MTTCSSELVLLAMSTAVESAKSASAEPSVASSTLVGKILIYLQPLLLGVFYIRDLIV